MGDRHSFEQLAFGLFSSMSRLQPFHVIMVWPSFIELVFAWFLNPEEAGIPSGNLHM